MMSARGIWERSCLDLQGTTLSLSLNTDKGDYGSENDFDEKT